MWPVRVATCSASPVSSDSSPVAVVPVDFELQRIREADLPATGDPAVLIRRMYQEMLAEEAAMRAEDAVAADLREARSAILPTTGDPQDILDRWAVELADDAGDDPPIAMRTRSRAPTSTSLTALSRRSRPRRVDAGVDEGESVAPSPSLFSDSPPSQQ